MHLTAQLEKNISSAFFLLLSLLVFISIAYGYMKIMVNRDFTIFTSTEDIERYDFGTIEF